jgi:hypothetical protein
MILSLQKYNKLENSRKHITMFRIKFHGHLNEFKELFKK